MPGFSSEPKAFACRFRVYKLFFLAPFYRPLRLEKSAVPLRPGDDATSMPYGPLATNSTDARVAQL